MLLLLLLLTAPDDPSHCCHRLHHPLPRQLLRQRLRHVYLPQGQHLQLFIIIFITDSDSAQANTVGSRKLKCSQIQNWLTLQSWTLRTVRRLTLGGVKKICLEFLKTPFTWHLGSIWWYFEKFWLRAVLAYAEFCREQFCLCRPLLTLNEKTKKILKYL